MSTTYVAVDVETTGLDATNDSIIEIGAITFRDADILDQFSSLVNPHKEVPPFITQLTGITQEMVDDAPSMFSLRSKLRGVIGDHVLVGHNIGFDAAFLREERLGIGNHRVDTVTLASILYPEAGRFGLESLARFLNLPIPTGEQTHRAFDDAELTLELFLALKEKALMLELDILNEIVQSGRNLGWPETIFFEDVLAEKAQIEGGAPSRGRLAKLYDPTRPKGQLLAPEETPHELDVEIVSSMIRPGGNFDQAFPDFEYRPQQVQMLEVVTTAFNDGAHLMVEAGTGTGKSVAYLVPAAFWANENGRRVVISTNTINLQDQLINKDIPELQRLLPFELRAAVRKGRSNYLCTRLFQQMRHSGPSSADEMTLYARILPWLSQTESGDIAELTLRTPGERMAWSRLNAENPTCTADHCASENCPLHIAKRRAELAHIVIVNHSLLLADVAHNNLVLPEYVDLIVDEAHHLETAVTDGLSFRADRRFMETIVDEVIAPRSGLLAEMQKTLSGSVSVDIQNKFETVVKGMRQEAQYARERLDEFFMTLSYFLADKINRRSQFAQQIRITQSVRSQPDYDEVELSWDNLSTHLHGIADGFLKLSKGLGDLIEDVMGIEELVLSLMNNGRALEETRANMDGIIHNPKTDMIYWVEIFKERISLHAAPLHVGPLVEEHIFKAKETVILTSATMRTAGPDAREEANFNYIKERLHGHDVDEMAVGSPFDYKGNTLLYLVSDMPEPNQPGYQRYIEDAIVEVATTLGGRTMVLFTSYSQLTQTSRAIENVLSEKGVATLAQSQGSSRQQLLDQFKRPDARAVLLGTRSFWEGVDVPGDALQAVIIAKLPFDVPSDPIFAARSETFDNSFFEYSIPEAVLRFRQGFGRLNRRQTDEGIVFILDKRVISKRYGQMFVDALPECTVIRQRASRISELTSRWMNRNK